MERFLRQAVTRYRTAPHLRGWDAWNELRWNVNADGLVCFCEHTLAAFRTWLDEKYGGLDGLNRAWKRRYGSWDEVWPGKLPGRPYTEMMAFEHFLTWRASRHAKARYEVIKSLDPGHPVTVHGGAPSPLYGGSAQDQPLNRGNDWFFADDLDGVGCSSFPRWFHIDDAGFGMRVEFVKSAARDKQVWLSELQGGRAAQGFNIYAPVDASSQQRWVWNGIACGADTILFWCWRDEVFGRESDGFGLSGDDGLAEERLAAMKVTGRLIGEQRELLAAYRPVQPEVGVLFSPQSYYLHWAQEGKAERCMHALEGYARSLVRKSIPYLVVEEEHLDALAGLKVLFLPRTVVVDDSTAEALATFVRDGGTLVCESECGAFSAQGLYRYPEERFTARLSGLREVGRRNLSVDSIAAQVGGTPHPPYRGVMELGVTQWLTPWQRGKGQVWADHEDGALIVEVPVGQGKLVLCGAYLGDAYLQNWTAGFEDFVEHVVRTAGWQPEVEVLSPRPTQESFVYAKHGTSGGKRVAFVFFPAECDEVRLRFRAGFFPARRATDLISGKGVTFSDTAAGQECALRTSAWRLAILVEK